MIIVCDTGPLRYLIEVDAVHALQQIGAEIMSPPQVLHELKLPYFPQVVTRWAHQPPSWLKIGSPTRVQFLDRLDVGEAAAISLAHELGAQLLLIDDQEGRRVAGELNLKVIGTLGILREAGHEGLLDFHAAINRLITQTKFHHTRALIANVVAAFEQEERRLKQGGDPGAGP